MPDDMRQFEESFATEAEAIALQEGLEWADNDHIVVETPEPVGTDEVMGNWVVRFRTFA